MGLSVLVFSSLISVNAHGMDDVFGSRNVRFNVFRAEAAQGKFDLKASIDDDGKLGVVQLLKKVQTDAFDAQYALKSGCLKNQLSAQVTAYTALGLVVRSAEVKLSQEDRPFLIALTRWQTVTSLSLEWLDPVNGSVIPSEPMKCDSSYPRGE